MIETNSRNLEKSLTTKTYSTMKYLRVILNGGHTAGPAKTSTAADAAICLIPVEE